MHFLNQVKPTIMENVTSKEDLKKLDAQLYGQFKFFLPKDAPGSAFKRLNSKNFWEGVFNDCIAEEQSSKTNIISKNFQDSALDLLDEARKVSVSNIRKRLHDSQEGETSTSINNISVLNDNRFLDNTPTERVRSKIINFRIHADHVAEIHKQE